MVHHAIALGLHTTTLILVKGALDARGSKLMPDKKDFGYSFPCDGPGRGGTCDISAWDAFYLAVFWMLNTIGWVTFYWHWKHITLWQGNVSQFNESSTYLMGWLRDYLWLNSSQLINGYLAQTVTKPISLLFFLDASKCEFINLILMLLFCIFRWGALQIPTLSIVTLRLLVTSINF